MVKLSSDLLSDLGIGTDEHLKQGEKLKMVIQEFPLNKNSKKNLMITKFPITISEKFIDVKNPLTIEKNDFFFHVSSTRNSVQCLHSFVFVFNQ